MVNHAYHLIQTYHLWTEIFNKPYQQGLEAEVNNNYDYETRPDGAMRVYMDVGITLSYASVVYRSGFEFDQKALAWKDIFVPHTVRSMLKTAFEEAQKGYILFCQVNKIPAPESYPFPDELFSPFVTTIIEKYTLYRSISDEENAYLINTIVLECEPGFETYLIFKYTFDILQEVLFYHPSFSKEHNREVFSEIIPLPRYFTIRYNCKAIEYQSISLSGYDMVMFFQCLDCALQMLLGDKSDSLLSDLEKQGFNAEMQAAYIKSGTDHFNRLKKTLKDSNATIMNFENRVDWMSVIK